MNKCSISITTYFKISIIDNKIDAQEYKNLYIYL